MDEKTSKPAEPIGATQAALAAGRRLALELKPHPLGKRFAPYAILVDGTAEFVAGGEPITPPEEYAGTAEVHDADSFLKMWDEHAMSYSRVYAEMSPVKFTAVFDEHDPYEKAAQPFPRWRDHRCVYTPKHSAEWATWKDKDRKPFGGNAEFSLWLEDNLPDITDPPADVLLRIANTFRVDEGLVWANEVDLNNGRTDLVYRRVVDGQATDATGGRVAIPQQFSIRIPVFAGLEAAQYELDARFRYRVRERHLSIWYELVRPHKIMETAFRDLVEKFREGTGGQLYFGNPGR